MNQSQLKYAMARVDGIVKRKSAALRVKHTVPGKHITNEERADLIRAGKVKLHSTVTRIGNFDQATSLFDFSKYEYGDKLSDKFAAEVEKLSIEADKVRDVIMLGDEAAAKITIEAFEA